MKYIIIPEQKTIHQLPFYFAVEEYVARKYTNDDYFMAWRVEPTVMLGRNQLIENEVNIDYCKRNNIHILGAKAAEVVFMPIRVVCSFRTFRLLKTLIVPLLSI